MRLVTQAVVHAPDNRQQVAPAIRVKRPADTVAMSDCCLILLLDPADSVFMNWPDGTHSSAPPDKPW